MRKINEFLFLFSVSLFLILANPVFGSGLEGGSTKTPYKIPKITSKVKVDGNLNEKVWQEALVLELNYEVDPGENIKPPVKTEVLLIYSAKHLYVGFRAYDPDPSKIRSHYSDRDGITNDDHVGIVLDTFNDSRQSYQFYCNPYGVQADNVVGLITTLSDWDGIWDSAGKITEEGYVAEMSIPFSTLRFQKKKGDQIWGIDACRVYPRSLLHSIGLFPRDRSNNCYMCQAEKVSGFLGAKPGIHLEIDPTLTAILTQERESFPDGKFVKKTGKVEPGLTARWGFTPNLTLSAAVNPDFSHVEADAAQLDINTQFTLFYPEKRPFFLEGANIFSSRLYAIYTRTIVDPHWGVKVSGKEGRNAIGFFSVEDSYTNFIFPSSQSAQTASFEKNNISNAFRYRRDLGKSSNLGFIVTDREGDDYFNRLAGIDGDLRFTKKDRLMFQFIGSQTRYPDHIVTDYNQPADKFTGSALDAFYWHDTKNIDIFLHYQKVHSNFRADLGYADQVGNSMREIGGTYTWFHDPGHWYTLFLLGSNYSIEKDQQGNLLGECLQTQMAYFGPLQSHLHIFLEFGKMGYKGIVCRDNFLHGHAYIRPSGSLFLFCRLYYGDRIDFANVRPGKRLTLNGQMEYKLGRHLYLYLDHLFEKLNVEGGRLYTANITNLRLVYQFNRRSFLRTILQYIDYKYKPELYTFPINPLSRHFFSQVLFSYKINPQTVLFLGYSDDFFGDNLIPLTQNNRTFFLKIGYALVL